MSRNRHCPLAVVSVCAAIAALLIAIARADDEPAAKEDSAVAAARKRQATVNTVFVEFRLKEVKPRGSVSDALGPTSGVKEPVPIRDLTLESTNRLMLDGEMIRYEDNHPRWQDFHAADGKPLKKCAIYVFDGVGARSFFPNGTDGDAKTPFGLIHRDGPQAEFKHLVLAPVLAAFRGLHPTLSPWIISSMKPSAAAPVNIDAAACQEYVLEASRHTLPGRAGAASLTYEVYLDPRRDYVIRRVKTFRLTRLFDQLDINYRRDGAVGWVPDAWDYAEFSQSGNVLHTITVNVLKMRLNEPQPAEQFDLRFPPGTEVKNQVDTKTYHVQSDGSMGDLPHLADDEVLASSLLPEEPWYWNAYFLFGVGVVVGLVIIAAIYVWRRKATAA